MKSQTINNDLMQAQTMINNTKKHPVIKQKLKDWGYGDPQITRADTILANAKLAQQTKKESYSLKQIAVRTWRTEWTNFRQQYAEHRTVAKTVFRQEPETLMRARLDRRVPNRISDILDQAGDFYEVVAPKSKEMQKLGIKAEELTQAQANVASLSELHAEYLQQKGNAESATDKRKQALAELRTWLREFTKVAKMALKDDPQLLEVLGIVVPA
jgi:hypothetical protein